MKNRALPSLLLPLFLFHSCSWFSERKALFEPEEEVDQAKPLQSAEGPVSRDQYNDLLKRYEVLQEKLQNQAAAPGADQNLLQEIQAAKGEGPGNLSATVNMMEQGKEQGVSLNTGAQKSTVSPPPIEADVMEVNKAMQLIEQAQYDQALGLLKPLEQSSILAVRARVQYLLGEILFLQQEYELAAGVYENVLKKYASSGIVIKAIGRLIVCYQKLKMTEKESEYYSLLKVFGVEN